MLLRRYSDRHIQPQTEEPVEVEKEKVEEPQTEEPVEVEKPKKRSRK